MKKALLIIFIFIVNSEAQIDIEYLNDVPESFKKEYFSKPRIYNPLHIGDVWQYTGDGYYTNINITKDTVVNSIKYYKKVIDFDERIVTWERFDSSGNSFILDFEDIDEDGYNDDELPADSLELPGYSRFITYKHMYKYFSNTFIEGLTALIYDTLWVVFDKDTVLAKHVQYDICFCSDIICDKYGVIRVYGDGVLDILTGAIINGKQYGTIVNVEKASMNLPNEIKLGNNYPNPFNPVTTIDYTIPVSGMVTLKVYDTLGREVVTLVNENKNRGRYSVIFNAVDLPSGVYYYTLAIDSKKITKKMIFLK